MSNGSSNGGAPRDPFGGAGDGRAEDGYPTEAIPPQSNRPQGPPQQGRPGSPSGPSQQGYPPPGPHGYPPQSQPGYPQQNRSGNPQGYGPPPQGGQYGQGQPPQGYGPQNPHGYNQSQSAYASQPNKSKTGMIVAIVAVIVALILATVAWFVMNTKAEQVTPPPTSAPTAVQPSDVEPMPTEDFSTAPGDPPTDGTAPPLMPEQVGDYTVEGEVLAYLNSYQNEDGAMIVVSYGQTGTIPGLVADLNDPQVIGEWTCGVEPDFEMNICVGEAQGGIAAVTAADMDANSIAAFGDELVELWK